MTSVLVNYATPSVFASSRSRALLGLAGDIGRPVRFHAKVARHVLPLRLALQALGELVWRSDEWVADGDLFFSLDPICTVHRDRLFFEALSGDQSAYGLVIADRALFEAEGEVQCGTTNVDFTAWLWAALAEMRSSRETHFRIGAEGLDVRSEGAGGRFEQKVEVPDAWVRGFLQLQGAMAMPGTRLSVRPVDLLAAIRFMRFTKAKVSPRALRYEMHPGRDAQLVLEPWEHVIPLPGAEHTYAEPRVIRTWGRRRLRLIEPLLPYADRVDVYLKGRALPSFYAVKLPGITFVLGLSGWTGQRWTDSSSFDLLVAPSANRELEGRARELLQERQAATATEVASTLGVEAGAATGALAALCAEGRCVFDVEARAFRHRELFAEPIDVARVYPPDPRREAAAQHIAAGRVEVLSAAARETRKHRRLRTPDGPVFREVVWRDWVATGRVADQADVELVLSNEERLIFGRCGCVFFRENLLNRGPCEHLLALLQVAQAQRVDGATSRAVDAEEWKATQAQPRAERRAPSEHDEGDDEALDEDGSPDDDA